MRRAAGIALLGLLPLGLLTAWAWSDSAWAELPPASLAQAKLVEKAAGPDTGRLSRLVAGLAAGLAAALPARSAPPLNVDELPAWHPPAVVPRVVTRRPADVAALRDALQQAQPGEVIELQPGDHVVSSTLYVGHAGQAEAPIVLRGAPGARLLSETVETLKLKQPHWVIEQLEMVGHCPQPAQCEHAVHVVGAARNTTLTGLLLRDFNAAIKVNGEDGTWPDRGLVSDSLLLNTAPRPGAAPATPFDLVGASFWRFERNRVWGVAKAGGNGVAYGAFMKGGGQGGRFVGNLVVCAPQPAFAGAGAQVGLSFGGGKTDPKLLRDQQTRLEHIQGVAEGNVVLNCNDTALDVNEAVGIVLRGNILLGGGGVLVRGQGASAEYVGNVSSRPEYARPGNQIDARGNRRFEPAAHSDARQVLEALKATR